MARPLQPQLPPAHCSLLGLVAAVPSGDKQLLTEALETHHLGIPQVHGLGMTWDSDAWQQFGTFW